jgi:hypothetical protein
MGKFVVVVKAENGRIAAAYNEDGFTSAVFSKPLNLKDLLSLLRKMADEEKYTIKIIIESRIFLRMALCLGMVHVISLSQTIVIRTPLTAIWVHRMLTDRWLIDARCLGEGAFQWDYEVFKIVIEYTFA